MKMSFSMQQHVINHMYWICCLWLCLCILSQQ